MQWQLIVALVILIPVILFPAAFVWFLNVSGLWQVMKESMARERRQAIARKEGPAQIK